MSKDWDIDALDIHWNLGPRFNRGWTLDIIVIDLSFGF